MSICIDRCLNIIVNEGGKAHHTGWVLVTVVDNNMTKIGHALAQGKGWIDGRTFRTEWVGTPVRLNKDLPLSKDEFIALTGWKVEA